MSRSIVITGCSTGLGRLAAVLGSDFGVVRELNRVVEPPYDQLLADMGLAEVASIKQPS